MTVPSYTVYSGRPRCLCRDTDKTALTARTNSATQWQSVWNGTITSRANTLKGQTNSQLTSSKPDKKLCLLSFYGWIEESGRPADGYKDVAIRAAIYLAGLSDGVAPTDKRERILALLLVFDFCFDDMTTTEKNTLAAELDQQRARMSKNPLEQMDGWSRTDQVMRMLAAITVHGYSTYSSKAASDLQDALEFLYGVGPGEGCIEMLRWEGTDGGNDKGSWYIYQAATGGILWMQGMTKGTTHNAWVNEAPYLSRMWEWMLWTGWISGAAQDMEANQDMARGTAPRMHHLQRWMYGAFATNYPTPFSTEGGGHLKWLWEQWDAVESGSADDRVWDVILFDREATASIHPKDAASPIATSRMFSPPGVYFYRGAAAGQEAWDYDESVVVRIMGRERYRLGHPHLDAGSVQIRYKDDVLLQSPAGYYDAFSSSHHVDAYQRTWLQSLAPLILDTSQVYQRYSQTVALDGGQHFKKVMRSGSPASDPDTVANMLNEGGGLAWLSCNRFEKFHDDSNVVGLVVDSAPAYQKFHTDTPVADILEIKYLIIKPNVDNGLTHLALLYYARIKKRVSSWEVKIPIHSAGPITTNATGATWTGYRTIAGDGSPGKMTMHLRSAGSYSMTNNTPGSPLDSNGYGPDQFRIGGNGGNRPPSEATPARHRMDLKRHSLYIERLSKISEEHYVMLFMPTAAADTPPTPTWITDGAEPNFYAVQIGTKTYGLHRTADVVFLDASDTTPPAEVTGQALAPRDGALLYTWTDPADSDLDQVEVFYRTSAV